MLEHALPDGAGYAFLFVVKLMTPQTQVVLYASPDAQPSGPGDIPVLFKPCAAPTLQDLVKFALSLKGR